MKNITLTLLVSIILFHSASAEVVSVKMAGKIDYIINQATVAPVQIGDVFEFDYKIDYSIPPFAVTPQDVFYFPISTSLKIGKVVDIQEDGWFTTYDNTVFGDGYSFNSYITSPDFIQYTADLWTSDLSYIDDPAAKIKTSFPLLNNLAAIVVGDSPTVDGVSLFGYSYGGQIQNLTISTVEGGAVPEPTTFGFASVLGLFGVCVCRRVRKCR